MRYFLLILSFAFCTIVRADYYRIFFSDKGEVPYNYQGEMVDLPVNTDYLAEVSQYCDEVVLTSKWLNYSLVKATRFPVGAYRLSFVSRIEKVEPTKTISFQGGNSGEIRKGLYDKHRRWQLDTLGYSFFNQQKIDGSGIVIAILDAGFSGAKKNEGLKHIFETGRVLKTWDFLDNDSNVFHGASHGTLVWTCIAGKIDEKPTGLASGASFILLRTEDNTKETIADEDRWIKGLEMAYENGADIVNSSVGFAIPIHKKSELNGSSLISRAAQIATEKGLFIVQAAGNEYINVWKTITVPADAEGVIAVGAIDRKGNHAIFSSVGPTVHGITKPDVVAPGTAIAIRGDQFVSVSGTSFSTPLVSGYLACVLQFNESLIPAKEDFLKLGGLSPYHDNVYGYGVPQPPDQNNVLLDSNMVMDKRPCCKVEIDIQSRTLTVVDQMQGSEKVVVFVTIKNVLGKVKFTKRLVLKANKKYKIPSTKCYRPFRYEKYFRPDLEDIWTVRTPCSTISKSTDISN